MFNISKTGYKKSLVTLTKSQLFQRKPDCAFVKFMIK